MLLRQVRWFGANGKRALDALRGLNVTVDTSWP